MNGLGEFYDRQTGARFVPRGMNYVRISEQSEGVNRHSTFDPDLYNAVDVDQALGQMESDGYNVVRVFVDCCSSVGQQVGKRGGGLNMDYMARIVDFLLRARMHHIYVLLIVHSTPTLGGYNTEMWKAVTPLIGGQNVRYLTSAGLEAKRHYMLDFVQALLDLRAPLDAIFAYDLTNEIYFDSSSAPFKLSSGMVTVVNGNTYDMAIASDKQRLVNQSLIYWINQLRTSVRTLDPTALVTASFFVPQGPAPLPEPLQGSNYVLTRAVINLSDADFIDLHAYPGWGVSLADYARNFGITAQTVKPVIMGEFGAIDSVYPGARRAASELQTWQIQSCQYGFDGWLVWTWDTEDQGFWTAVSGDGAIEQALSPNFRPDPCKTE